MNNLKRNEPKKITVTRNGVTFHITITRYSVDGFTLSAIVDGHLFIRRYIGYTLTEAKTRFLEEVNKEEVV